MYIMNLSHSWREEVSNYDSKEIDKYIKAVRKEIHKLDKKNEQLELQNNEQNIHYVESFMRVYEKTIVEQAKDMEKLLTEIKEVMYSKEYLHGKKDHYEKLLRSERFTDLIQKIRRIKEIKVEMYDFLKTKGNSAPLQLIMSELSLENDMENDPRVVSLCCAEIFGCSWSK